MASNADRKGPAVTLAADTPAIDRTRRRISRIERQARVGILRNTNEPPRPPPRRASLTGRWLSLRSSRRPPPPSEAAVSPVAEAPPPRLEDAIRLDPEGRVAGINVPGLIAAVEGLGTQKPIRTPYGANIRPDSAVQSGPAPGRRRPAILNPDSWREDAAPPDSGLARPLPDSPTAPARRRDSGLAGPILGGVVVAFVMLVLLPAAFGL